MTSFNTRDINLYQEVPAIEVQGNLIERVAGAPLVNRDFNPRADRSAELYDSDNDLIIDSQINEFSSLGNAANRLLDVDLAACVVVPTISFDLHEGYLEATAWAQTALPDRMPATADGAGTNGTQFIQLILPFEIEASSIFNTVQANPDQVDYLEPEALTIEDEDGDHVFCTVLVNGVDVDGTSHVGDANLPAGINFSPGSGKQSIVFIAQAAAGLKSIPGAATPFATWAGADEIRIHLIKVTNTKGEVINTNSKWMVLQAGATPVEVAVESITAVSTIKDTVGATVMDYDDPTTPSTSPRTTPLVTRETNFLINFNKPVIPETVAQSIVFDGAPFNGNTGVVFSTLVANPPLPSQNPCALDGLHRDPIAPNVALVATILNEDGTASNVRGTIPFRCYPLHQNNLCTYVLNPVIDLPGSSDLGSPLFSASPITRMRITVWVLPTDINIYNGAPLPYVLPVNMGVCGMYGLNGDAMRNTVASEVFTVTSGGRYVNAPVSPHALYYTMGPAGMGVVDLDGNGFTTNDPDFSREALVTSQLFYSRFGNSGLGIGNNYSYAAKATTPPGGGPPTYIGLGAETPMPGINEGSSGIDEIVRDSNGEARLYPPVGGGDLFFNISDVEVGDFLDTLYFDMKNPSAHKSYHQSVINQAASGSIGNNMIATPPTPNPPPLTVPVGMRATQVILDNFDIVEEGALVIMGKEVFTMDLPSLGGVFAVNTGFIHLNPAELAGSSTDETFPPNPSNWNGTFVDYMNLGPVAYSCTLGLATSYGTRQQIGNFLFVADKSNNAVRVLNSNTMDVITSLSGLAGPDSVAVTPDLSTLYVTNSGGSNVTAFNTNPRMDNFLTQVAQINVGQNPKGICIQPEQESIFVCNYGSNTISVINPKTNMVRKTMSSLINRPWDMVVGPRQTLFGFGTQVYHGYVSNHGGDNVLVYESGPDGVGGVGFDDILDAVPAVGENGQAFMPLQDPRGICWDPNAGKQYPYSGGCYLAHRGGNYAAVSRIEFTGQQAPYGPIFLIPNSGAIGGTPGFGVRVFVITAQWGGFDNPLSGDATRDVALMDYNRRAWEEDNWSGNFDVTNVGDLSGPQAFLPMNNKCPLRLVGGAYRQTNNPDRLFVSYENTPVIDVLDTSSNQVLKTITGLPAGAKILKTYFKY